MVDLWARMSRTERHGCWCAPGRAVTVVVAGAVVDGERLIEVASVDAVAAGEL